MPSSSSNSFLNYEDDDSCSVEFISPKMSTGTTSASAVLGRGQNEREGNSTSTTNTTSTIITSSSTTSNDYAGHGYQHRQKQNFRVYKDEDVGKDKDENGREKRTPPKRKECDGYEHDTNCKRQQTVLSRLAGNPGTHYRGSIVGTFGGSYQGREGHREEQQDWDHGHGSSPEYKRRKKTCHKDGDEEKNKKQKIVAAPRMASFPVEGGKRKEVVQEELQEDYTSTSSATTKKAPKKNKTVAYGRRGDPRMNKAVAARSTRPELTLFQALLIGGFKFPGYINEISVKYSNKPVFDSDGVLLTQRKNQLSRRLRYDELRLKEMKVKKAEEHMFTMAVQGVLATPTTTSSKGSPVNFSRSTAGTIPAAGGVYSNNFLPLPAFQLQAPNNNPFLPSHQTNSYQVHEKLPLYHASAHQLPLLQNHSQGFFDPSQSQDASIKKYHLANYPSMHTSISNCPNVIHTNSIYHDQSRIETALLSSYNIEKEVMKNKNALAAFGFREDQIDESLLGAMNDQQYPRNYSFNH